MRLQEYKKMISRVIYAWVAIVFCLIAILINIQVLIHFITQERQFKNEKADLIEFTYKIEMMGNTLTNSLLNYSVTLNPMALANYWTELVKIRDAHNYLLYLKKLNSTNEEIDLLIQAKDIAHDLKKTEMKAIMLMLTAYGINNITLPPQIQLLPLSDSEKELTPQQQIDLAQNLLHTPEYLKDKSEIMSLINLARQNMSERTQQNVNEEKRWVSYSFVSLTILTSLTLIIVITIIWLRALSIKKWIK